MNKKNFTLFLLGFLLIGSSFTGNAQLSISDLPSGGTFINSTHYRISADREYLFSDCKVTLNFELGSNISSIGGISESDTLYVYSNETLVDKYAIPVSAQVKSFSLPYDTPKDVKAGTTLKFTFEIHKYNTGALITTITGKELLFTYVDYPTIATVIDGEASYDYYYERTTKYPGRVEFTKKGGSKDMEISLNGGLSWYRWDHSRWEQSDDKQTIKLTPVQIQNMIPGTKILVREPYSCKSAYSVLGVPSNHVPTNINRQILIPKTADALINPGSGLHAVTSRGDFTFQIRPTGANEGLTPVVTSFPKVAEDRILVKEGEDGVWTVTLVYVQHDYDLDITFKDAGLESAAGNAAVEGDSKVWSAGGTLYIAASASGNARIYSGTGALVKTVACTAGTAGIPLPSGFYIVSLSAGGNYKVAVK
jgi:hypothetical protein